MSRFCIVKGAIGVMAYRTAITPPASGTKPGFATAAVYRAVAVAEGGRLAVQVERGAHRRAGQEPQGPLPLAVEGGRLPLRPPRLAVELLQQGLPPVEPVEREPLRQDADPRSLPNVMRGSTHDDIRVNYQGAEANFRWNMTDSSRPSRSIPTAESSPPAVMTGRPGSGTGRRVYPSARRSTSMTP